MIIQVADAIGCLHDDCERLRADGRPRSPPRPSCEDCLCAARAAIEAMRAPTPHMVAIGDATPTGHSWGIGGEFAACEPLWEAMIDAALEEPADA